MTVSEKIKTIDNKTKRNERQYKLDRETAKISALSTRDVVNINLTGGDLLP